MGEATTEMGHPDDHRGAVLRDAMHLLHHGERVGQVLEAVVTLHMIEVVVGERVGESAQVMLHIGFADAVVVDVDETCFQVFTAAEVQFVHARGGSLSGVPPAGVPMMRRTL